MGVAVQTFVLIYVESRYIHFRTLSLLVVRLAYLSEPLDPSKHARKMRNRYQPCKTGVFLVGPVQHHPMFPLAASHTTAFASNRPTNHMFASKRSSFRVVSTPKPPLFSIAPRTRKQMFHLLGPLLKTSKTENQRNQEVKKVE